MLLETSCKPSATCVRCIAGFRRICETHQRRNGPPIYKFTHHVDGAFEDCEDQKYERVTYGAYARI